MIQFTVKLLRGGDDAAPGQAGIPVKVRLYGWCGFPWDALLGGLGPGKPLYRMRRQRCYAAPCANSR